MMLTALGLAWGLRLAASQPTGSWIQRWRRSLFFFLFPPLLLLMTVLAVLYMGPQGQMLGLKASWFSYFLALGFIGWAGVFLLNLAHQGWLSRLQVRTYSQQLVAGKMARILDATFPYSAQIGFWQPELVISRGLLNTLDRAHLQAVLAHEQAHYQYCDTFWFFWLGWLRSFTAWLPNTEALWQELLLLRELRADRRAAEQVDALLLAESLLVVAQRVSNVSVNLPESFCVALSCAVSCNHLAERIDALLIEPESPSSSGWWTWSWMLLPFLPLVTVPFHY
ncbi:MAG: M56 family metallopeptidase [Xenococcaceae cyanobacterium]